jgi:ABC-type branched-subunit amino acid transport system substrate-binding protein
MRGRTGRIASALVVVAALGTIGAACSRDDESSGAPDADTSTTTRAPSGGRVGFGDLENVCQPGDASGATAPGVTDDAIRVATISDPGFEGRPGLNQELFDTAEVFTEWCNAAGGINGREVEVDLRDAALVNYKPRILESCREDFMLVGGGAVFDDTGTADRLECLLPDVAGYVVTPEARGADLLRQPLPSPVWAVAVGDYRWLGERFPESTEHVGILTGNLPTTVTVANQDREAIESLGWKVVYSDQYPAAGVTSWAPYVQAMKARGVEGLAWVGEPEGLAKLEQAMADANFEVAWVRAGPNHYDERLVAVAGGALRNTYVASSFVPFEDTENPAMRAYLDAFEQYRPDAKTRAVLGVQAWSAWLLFAHGARECGSELTRRCVYDTLGDVHEWTGGGLHAATDPGRNRGSGCYLLFRATSEGFSPVDVEPTDGIFHCGAENVYELEDPPTSGVKLADVGRTLDDLE